MEIYKLHCFLCYPITIGTYIINLACFNVYAVEPDKLNKQCAELSNSPYGLKSSKNLNPVFSNVLIVLNGISSSDTSGSIRANHKLISSSNKLGYSLEFNWNNTKSNNLWWSVQQGLPPQTNLQNFDRVAFDIYPIMTNATTHVRVFLTEEDGDRWIVTDLNIKNNIKAGVWNHFELSRSTMRPWLLGDKYPDWQRIRTLTIETWSALPGKGKTIFLLDDVKLLGSGLRPVEVFNTNDDGDWVSPSSNESMQPLPSPGVVYLPGIGSERLSGTPKQFQKLLGRVGTSHIVGSKATELVKSGIPVIGYTALGQGYEKFLTRRGAWDVNAAGEGPGNIPLLQKSFTYFHTIALSHSGVASALQNRIDGMLRSGIGTFMAVDYTFPWNQGPFGYSEAMLTAYRDDLQALDTGLQLIEGNQSRVIYFPEYFRLYHGFFPQAQDLSLSDWSRFTPPRPGENKFNIRAYWRLFYFLRSYEWLKLAGRTGRYMQCRGGHGLWVIPNPEDISGSSDYSMLLRTAGVTNVFPEWFGRIATISSAAYYSGPYLREQANRGNSRLSVLFETGSGGHAAPYWDWQNAFNGAYALTAATQADDFDNDFIDQAPFQDMVNPKTNPAEFNRFRDTVSKAFGFQLAREQKAKRASSTTLYVTERPPLGGSSIFFAIEDKLRPGLASSLWRSHAIFDVRDSLELEKVLERYETIFYSPISPRNGDFEHLQSWLKRKSGRMLVTHSFVPTRSAKGYWGGDSGTTFGSIEKALFGIGLLKPSNIKEFKITSVNNKWKDFVSVGKTFILSESLSQTQNGQPIVTSNVGSIVSKNLVGSSEVIYLHYTPGYSPSTRLLDQQITNALLRQRQQKNVVLADGDVSVQSFNVSGGRSIILWDMPSEKIWARDNEFYRTPLPWKSKKVNRTILVPAGSKQKIYDFWRDKVTEVYPQKGYINLSLTGITSNLYFLGSDTETFSKTIKNAQRIRKKIKTLYFDAS
jgi:hypothetical protein